MDSQLGAVGETRTAQWEASAGGEVLGMDALEHRAHKEEALLPVRRLMDVQDMGRNELPLAPLVAEPSSKENRAEKFQQCMLCTRVDMCTQ